MKFSCRNMHSIIKFLELTNSHSFIFHRNQVYFSTFDRTGPLLGYGKNWKISKKFLIISITQFLMIYDQYKLF